jgi:hypothetical protein
MSTNEVGALVGLLAEEDRLKVFAAVVLGATSTEEVVAATGLDRRRAVQALERLGGGRLVVAAADGSLRVAGDRFKEAARQAAAERPTVKPEELGATPEQADVLRNFMADGRLTSIPAQRTKRVVVLDFLAQKFEPGKAYPERDVNFILGTYHRDYAALRRYLVDEGFLERRDGFYWRSGGTFDVD